jgi:predicted nucleic acid-binding protein
LSCLVDTSCLVALTCAAHEHHEATRTDLDERSARRERLLVAAHSLAEAYAVLTRLPPPFRLAPGVAIEALLTDWRREQAITLTATEVWTTLGELPAAGVSGGRTYDALIAACARKARVRTVLTWNTKHFESLGDGFDVVSPALTKPG